MRCLRSLDAFISRDIIMVDGFVVADVCYIFVDIVDMRNPYIEWIHYMICPIDLRGFGYYSITSDSITYPHKSDG